MIDYFIVSISLLGLVLSVLADFSSEWAPHYGIELTLRAMAKDILNLELAKPSMPKDLAMYDADAFEENSFQVKGKAKCKLDQKRQREAKFEEVRLRDINNGMLWDKLFSETPLRNVVPSFANSTSTQVSSYFEKMVGEQVGENKLTNNFAIWCQTLQAYYFAKCGETPPANIAPLGMLPAVVRKKILRPAKSDVAKLLLPGGGDLSSRIWAGIRVQVKALSRWCDNKAFDTPAFFDAVATLSNFVFLETGEKNTDAFCRAWQLSTGMERLQVRCEIMFLCEAAINHENYESTDLLGILGTISFRAVKEGKAKAKKAHEDFIAKALVGSAGLGHKLAKVDTALPPLRLVFKEEKDGSTHFISDPIEVAMLHSLPWCETWKAYSSLFNADVVANFAKL